MIVAGEASGDYHGTRLVRAMQALDPGLFFCGIGGDGLRTAGVRILVDAHSLSVVGITEIFSKLPDLLKGIGRAKSLLRNLRPDLLILIDFPDFNLHLAATAKRLGVPVLYYISPQIWAWRPGRVRKIGRRVDHMAVILPFEEKFYRKHGIPATYVGHPLLDHSPLPPATAPERRGGEKPVPAPASVALAKDEGEASPPFTPREGGPGGLGRIRIGLLPGSRDREIARHLPLMLSAANEIRASRPDTDFIVSLASSVKTAHLKAIMAGHPGPSHRLVPGGAVEAFRQCDLVIAVSGTVTLEAALHGIPMVILYKVSPLSYWLGRLMIRVKHISLANLISGRTVVPELIQDKATPRNIAEETLSILDDPHRFHRIKSELANIRHRIVSAGGTGAAVRVAHIAVDMLRGNTAGPP
jgi:lipid-A-disaccharide synthase